MILDGITSIDQGPVQTRPGYEDVNLVYGSETFKTEESRKVYTNKLNMTFRGQNIIKTASANVHYTFSRPSSKLRTYSNYSGPELSCTYIMDQASSAAVIDTFPKRTNRTNIGTFICDLTGFFQIGGMALSEFNSHGTITSLSNIKLTADVVSVMSGGGTITDLPPNFLYIPNVMMNNNPRFFSTIAVLARAAGSQLVTNETGVTDGCMKVRVAAGFGFARDIASVLNFLYKQLPDGSSREAAAFAFTCGIHTGTTLASHTDEGGCTRDVLRSFRSAPPCGAICPLPRHNHMLIAEVHNVSSLCAMVEQIMLGTAALVPFADPRGSEDIHMPTVCTNLCDKKQAEQQVNSEPKNTVVIKNQFNIRLRAVQHEHRFDALKATLPAFMSNYCELISIFFNVPDAQRFPSLFTAVNNIDESHIDTRHLPYDVFCPYFWVEPSGVFTDSSKYTRARPGSANLLHVYCDARGVKTLPALASGIEEVVSPQMCGYRGVFGNLRNSPIFAFCLNSKEDGLKMMDMIMSSRYGIVNPASFGCRNTVEQPGRSPYYRFNIGEAVWNRYSSYMIPPTECIMEGIGFLSLQRSSTDGLLMQSRTWVPEVGLLNSVIDCSSTPLRLSEVREGAPFTGVDKSVTRVIWEEFVTMTAAFAKGLGHAHPLHLTAADIDRLMALKGITQQNQTRPVALQNVQRGHELVAPKMPRGSMRVDSTPVVTTVGEPKNAYTTIPIIVSSQEETTQFQTGVSDDRAVHADPQISDSNTQ